MMTSKLRTGLCSLALLLAWPAAANEIPAAAGETPAAAALVEQLIPMPREVAIASDRLVAPRREHVTHDVPATWGDEQYELIVGPRAIEIRAKTEQGVIWARRTLEQLRTADGRYPQVRIADWPEFPMRGFLWDDGRNFAGLEIIRHYIDLMSAYKLNLFHWHLTDHPAWRIESRCYPQLNDGQYQRPGRDTGCYYTYDEIRSLIAYARERGILVVPELDMPGHSTYFPATFGCAMDSDQGRAILERCIEEFCREIPAELCPYIHIGSDEVHIADPKGFMAWAQQTVRSHGRETFVWDPGLPADSASIRQIWREGASEEAAVTPGVRYVDSSMGYLNYYDPLLFPAKLFFHTPCYTGAHSRYALGGILCMWNDVRVADKHRTEHHNGMMAGMMVYAERFWNGGTTTDRPTGTLLPADTTEAMQRFERFERRMEAHKAGRRADELRYWTPVHAPKWEVTMEVDSVVHRFEAWGDILDLDALSRAHGIRPDRAVTCRIRRTILSPNDTLRFFKAGFESPARSNRISDGIGEPDCWPNGGRLIVNGAPIPPPRWEEPGAYRFHFNTWARPEEEFPYTDEQLYWMRRPLPVRLQAGENVIELTVRRHFGGQRFHIAFIETEAPEPLE